MDSRILRLTPKRYLCPYCGQWHEMSKSSGNFICDTFRDGWRTPSYNFYFRIDTCRYLVKSVCERANLFLNGEEIPYYMVEHLDKPIVTFNVKFTSSSKVGHYYCRTCHYSDVCNCAKLGDMGDNRNMTITLGFEYEPSEYKRIVKNTKF